MPAFESPYKLEPPKVPDVAIPPPPPVEAVTPAPSPAEPIPDDPRLTEDDKVSISSS